MYLNELFKEAPNMLIEQISCDSRVPMKNCIYFCMNGVKYDGHDFIEEAIKNGANVIVYTKDIDTTLNAIYIKVKNINNVLAKAAKMLYNFNSNDLEIFISCGCYGKSCVSSYINQLIDKKELTSSIGSYGINYLEQHFTYPSATLSLLDNYRYLSKIKEAGCKYCSLEINTSSISYNRLEGIEPKSFIYTVTSQYSNDYKGFSDKYFDILRKYLYTLEDSTKIVLNRDDISYNELINACSSNVVTYGFNEKSTYVISNPVYYLNKTTFDIKYEDKIYNITSPLLSKMNVYYLTAAIITIIENKIDTIENIINRINLLKSPEGIMDKLDINDKNIIVDYCYALDSYIELNDYIKKLDNLNKIYFIMPVNYNDDADSISSYFKIIKDTSFLTIFTENMIYEDDIHDLLNEAFKCAQGYNFLTIEDRIEAIKTAINLLDKNDLLLILGKGNGHYFNKNYSKIVYEGDKNICLEYIKSISV